MWWTDSEGKVRAVADGDGGHVQGVQAPALHHRLRSGTRARSRSPSAHILTLDHDFLFCCSRSRLANSPATYPMSLQINLSSRDLTQAYQDVVNARGIDWAIFTYDKGTNDLKVQATGDGGLEELQEEFSDGR